MKLNTGLVLTILAGAAAPAFATDDAAPKQVRDARSFPQLSINSRSGFQGRVTGNFPVYDTGIPNGTAAAGDFRGPGDAGAHYDDAQLSTTAAVTINGLKFGIWDDALNTADHLWLKMQFYPTHNGTNAATSSDPPFAGTPISNIVDLGTGWAAIPFGLFFGTFVDLAATETVALPAAATPWGVRVTLWNDATATTPAYTGITTMSRGLLTCWPVGASDPFRWFTAVGTSATTTGPLRDERNGGVGNTRAHFWGLQAATTLPDPFVSVAQGTLSTNSVTSSGNVLASGGISWHSFTISSDATDTNGAGRFLDIDSEGSSGAVALALYKTTGQLVAFDDGSGSGTNSQLTFGIGRRAAVGDGKQYDGRNYDPVTPALADDIHGLSAGSYLLAVAPSGCLAADGFQVNCRGGAGATYSVSFKTNTGTGAALAASVAPIVAATDDLTTGGPLVSPGGLIPTFVMPAYNVRWIKFTTCQDANATNTVTITLTQPDGVGTAHFLFDSAGNLVASSNAGAAAAPNLLFNNCNLPRGTYYLAQTYRDGTVANFDTTGGRWHLRSREGSSDFDFSGTVAVTNSACGSLTCVADVDDGTATGTADGGVTIDDLLYYLALFDLGVLCADVDDGTGTGTKDGGVTIDDLLYYLFRFDAGC